MTSYCRRNPRGQRPRTPVHTGQERPISRALVDQSKFSAFRDRVLVIALGRQICYSLVLDALLTTADPDSLCPARFIRWSAVPQ